MDNQNYIVLTKNEIESLSDFIQQVIFVKTKYYCTDALQELDDEDRKDVKKDIEKLWEFRDQIIGKDGHIIYGHEFINKLECDMSFDIFDVLYDEPWGVDNPEWLYNILSVWKKCYTFIKDHNRCETCCGC